MGCEVKEDGRMNNQEMASSKLECAQMRVAEEIVVMKQEAATSNTFTPEEVDEILKDRAYWNSFGKALGWSLYGFSGREFVSFRTTSGLLRLSGAQCNDIMRAITTQNDPR